MIPDSSIGQVRPVRQLGAVTTWAILVAAVASPLLRIYSLASGQVGPAWRIGDALAIEFAGMMFIIWMLRVRSNADLTSDVPARWKKPWLIFGWILPVGSLWIPYRLVREMTDRDQAASPRLVGWWWGTYIVGVSIPAQAQAALRLSVKAGAWTSLALSPFRIAAAVLAVVIVRSVVSAQESGTDAATHTRWRTSAPQLTLGVVCSIALTAVAFLATGLLRNLPHPYTGDPRKDGYAYGWSNQSADCDGESKHRFSDSLQQIEFATGCLSAQTDQLTGKPSSPPSNP